MPKYVSQFNILGELIQVKDAAASGLVESLKARLHLADGSKVLTVGAIGAQFNSINAAINHAIAMGVSNANPVAVLIYPGTYNEQIVLNDVHGLTFIGCGIDKTTIEFNGSYPDCVIHVQGDVTFANLSIHILNNNTYAIHDDALDTAVTGKVSFIGCHIYGGSSAVGYGSGNNSELYLENCILEGTDSIVYGHNSPYSGRANQSLVMIDNYFKHTTEDYMVQIDDAGNSYGVSSVMNVVASGNTSDALSYPKVLFRKNTGDVSQDKTYLPDSDANIKVGPGNRGNAAEGLNFRKGNVTLSFYLPMPSSPDTSGNYVASAPIDIDIFGYNRTLNDVTLPGVGSITSSFGLNVSQGYLTLSTANAAVAGKSVSVNIVLTTL